MIAFVRGRVVEIGLERVVLDVGGLGMQLTCPTGSLNHLRTDEIATVHTALVVREDSWTMYAFANAEQRGDFEILQTVSGVGPRLALAMIATLNPTDLRKAIDRSDLVTLTKVPGVGRKGAQRLVIELTGKLGAVAGDSGFVNQPTGWRDSVSAGLVSLGWSGREADAAVDAISDEATLMEANDSVDVSALLRLALRSLDRV
ncbi:MAG: Holliday junction branch migration protein RuvA [Actinobacteria bacterium]|nr:Holliday junction branch migration protein RuvA [Actinomycetota bacterium]